MKKRKTSNATAVRSRHLIKVSTLALMKKERLADISVGQICAQAQLTRPTFYNHFESKDQVVESIIDDALSDFSAIIEEKGITSTEAVLRAFLDFWEERRALLKLLAQNDLLSLVGDRLEEQLELIYELSPFTFKGYSSKELAFHNAFLAAGTMGMLGLWAQTSPALSADEVSKYMEHMISSVSAGMEKSARSNRDR